MTTFALSPSVIVTESDLTTIVPAVATTDAALAGVFGWGPVGEATLLDSELTLRDEFGGPTALNYETWFTAANFLAYGSREYLVRVANTTSPTPSANFSIAGTANTILTMVGANATYSPITLGIVAGMKVYWTSNNMSVMNETSVVASSNATTVTLVSNTVANSSVYLGFYTGTGAYTSLAIYPAGRVENVALHSVRTKADYALKDGTWDTDVAYMAKWPGRKGDSLRISVCDSSDAYYQSLTLGNGSASVTANVYVTVGSNTGSIVFYSANVLASNQEGGRIISSLANGDLIEVGNTSIGKQYLKVKSVSATPNTSNALAVTVTLGFEDPYRLSTDYASNTLPRYWEYYNLVDTAPGQSNYVRYFGNNVANDEIHVVITDQDGAFTGTPGEVLETYRGLSRATDAKSDAGQSTYYKDMINKASRYVWWASDRAGAPSANALLITSSTNKAALSLNFIYGRDGADESTISVGDLATGYDVFAAAEDFDISLVMQGKPRGGVDPTTGRTGFQLANYIIDNVVEHRKDCVAFISPTLDCTFNNFGQEALSLVNWRNATRSSSYAVMDSGYKLQYDKYNDTTRWVPLNGDIAGLCARTDATNDPWWSPAGLNRGRIKNLDQLAWNPRMTYRDILYKNNVNPIVTFKGDGTVMWGDKTLQAKPSAFDRINVRRLFIVLEKAIATAAKYTLFELNDPFTRAQFKNMVVPYLRDVQGRRGITDFLVVCDETNNTGQVIDSNRFVGDIYIKPERSINWVQLNFVAVGTAVSFNEIVGRVGA